MQAAHQLVQLRALARLGQDGAANVVFQIQILISDPNRIGQLKRHIHQLAPEHRGQMHALGNVVAQVVQKVAFVAWWQLVDVQPTHVHRCLRRFHV